MPKCKGNDKGKYSQIASAESKIFNNKMIKEYYVMLLLSVYLQ